MPGILSGQQTGSTSGQLLIPGNPYRKSLLFTNLDAAINVFVAQLEPTVITTANAGVRLTPGQSLTLNVNDDGFYQVTERWSFIAASGTPIVAVFETESIRR